MGRCPASIVCLCLLRKQVVDIHMLRMSRAPTLVADLRFCFYSCSGIAVCICSHFACHWCILLSYAKCNSVHQMKIKRCAYRSVKAAVHTVFCCAMPTHCWLCIL